jgi:hypothetical protein
MKANFTLGVPGQATTFMRTKVVEEYVLQVRSRDGASSEKEREEILFDEPEPPADDAGKAAHEQYKMMPQ